MPNGGVDVARNTRNFAEKKRGCFALTSNNLFGLRRYFYAERMTLVKRQHKAITTISEWRQDLWDKGWSVGIVKLFGFRFLLWKK
jgi:hypothetical protein